MEITNAKKGSDDYLMDWTDYIIGSLVREKLELYKAYNYYNGVRDHYQYENLERITELEILLLLDLHLLQENILMLLSENILQLNLNLEFLVKTNALLQISLEINSYR